ncbi:MAG: M55 family metallopeptidase [Candidatus Neomarinimicrobiota bacterium]|jgi:D-amino peptidase|nr:M55 family metallopeptidase [Candidatus Neomarinimicrobiota bacterium]MDX9780713.1 M55 family metallopeptidase [bacterium]
MRFFISADIEGVTGINNWDETNKSHPDYAEFRKQMTREVLAACEGALAAGAKEIVVKDAHDSGRNILASELPKQVQLIRSWSRHPYSMVWGIEEGFDAAAFIGYHSPSASGDNPLSHTMSSNLVSEMQLNGELCSEFLLHALVARSHQVPVVFCSGDAGLCKRVKANDPLIETVATNRGVGNATWAIHPDLAVEKIRAGVEKALRKELKQYVQKIPEHFILDVRYTRHASAYRSSHYPGAKLLSPTTVRFECGSILDVMRYILFCV